MVVTVNPNCSINKRKIEENCEESRAYSVNPHLFAVQYSHIFLWNMTSDYSAIFFSSSITKIFRKNAAWKAETLGGKGT